MIKTNSYYHIFNHTNGFENLFQEDKNYRYFLQQWEKYISPIEETYVYCLMTNHLHFLIKIRGEDKIRKKYELDTTFGKFGTFQKFVSKQFANLYSNYTQAFIKVYTQCGSLFIPNFKSKEIDNEKYLLNLIYYIHCYPVRHKFCKDFRDWKHRSYHTIVSDSSSFF